MEKDTDMGYRCGRMELSTRATGETMWLMAEANSITLMEMSTMACGKTIRPTDTECIAIRTDRSMKETGLMISNMAKAKRLGLMAAYTMATMLIPRKKAKVFTNGQMATNTWGIGKIIRSMATVFICGPTAESTAASGRTT